MPRYPACSECGHRHGEAGAPPTCPPRNADHPDHVRHTDSEGHAIPRPFFMGESAMSGAPGTATGNGNNCLIHAIAQLVYGEADSPASRPTHEAVCSAVRDRLVAEHNCPPASFLEIGDWWAHIICALGCNPAGFSVTCFSAEHEAGAKLGSGPRNIAILNQGNRHFVPILPTEGAPGLLPRPAEESTPHPPEAASPQPEDDEWLGTPLTPPSVASAESPSPQVGGAYVGGPHCPAEDARDDGAGPTFGKSEPSAGRSSRGDKATRVQQLPDDSSEDRHCPSTLMALAREVAAPTDAIGWSVEKDILYLPPTCKWGHNWGVRKRNRQPRSTKPGAALSGKATSFRLRCRHTMEKRKDAGGRALKTEKGHKVKTACGSSAHLHPAGSIFEGTRADHGSTILGIWCWSQKMSPAQTTAATGLDPHVVTDLYHNLRLAATGVSMDTEADEMLGGAEKVVVIDEAFLSRRKYNKGRVIPTHQICILGGVEIEKVEGGEAVSGRRPDFRETGRCFLVQIPDRTKATFEEHIKKRVCPGTLVWTDGHASYEWLAQGGIYGHQRVNHKRGEWVGDKGQSTNAIEGMWPRVKRALRLGNTRKPVGNDYAPLFGESTRRMRYARGKDWRKRVFETAITLVAQEHGVDFQREMWEKAGFPCAGKSSLLR